MSKMIKEILEMYESLFRNNRLLTLIGVLSGLFAALSFLSREFQIYLSEAFYIDLNNSAAPITLLIMSIFSLSIVYLQSGGGQDLEQKDESLLKKMGQNLEKERKINSEQIRELHKKIERYESNQNLSEQEKKAIVAGVMEQTRDDTIKRIFEAQTDELKNEIRSSIGVERISEFSQNVVERLRREITDLRLRSNINLLIGMSITAGGLYLLWSTVNIVDSSELLAALANEETQSNGKFLRNLILPIVPRFLLVIFVEVFAYFFLKLYKDGLSEIKYFQNELTNIESKMAALEFSFITNNAEGMKTTIESLSSTERNFLIEKGQTTVDLEKAKTDKTLINRVLEKLPLVNKES